MFWSVMIGSSVLALLGFPALKDRIELLISYIFMVVIGAIICLYLIGSDTYNTVACKKFNDQKACAEETTFLPKLPGYVKYVSPETKAAWALRDAQQAYYEAHKNDKKW